MDLNLQTRVGKVAVEGVIGNSAGPRKELAEWHEVGRSLAGIITVGSFCPEQSLGNSGEVFWVGGIPEHALNSLGLPGKSPEEYSEEIEELRQYGKPINVSLAGFKPEDYAVLAKMFGNRGFSVKLNLTCPNVEGHGIFAFDLDQTRQTIVEIRDIIGDDNLEVKLNPHPDASYIDSMCRILSDEKVDVVGLCNTVPNCLILNPETLKPVITPNNGLAGYSGSAIKPIVMGQVFQYRQRLPQIGIVAEGGIWTGQDILDYFVAGADFCRIATIYAHKGAAAFAELTAEFVEQMENRGYESLDNIPRLDGLPDRSAVVS